jgi:hypothetical protein
MLVGTYMEAAKEFLTKVCKKASAKYSVNFLMLLRFCKRLEEGSGSKIYVKQFYDSF